MPMVDLSDADVQNLLMALRVSWETGNVKTEEGGAALASLRVKLQNSRIVKMPEPEKKPEPKEKKT